MRRARLGKLVSFENRRRLTRPRISDTETGQILIFTGVRYERGLGSVPQNGTTPARPKRKRG
jgi:hypothetical protein